MSPALSTSAVDACVFDAYGTLFDVASAAAKCADILGDKAAPLADLWRTKQLEYSWLRSLMDDYTDFWQITANALDHALDTLDLGDPLLRSKLMELYLRLDCYPGTHDVLGKLRTAGLRTAILSNGSPTMITAAVGSAEMRGLLDELLSVDEIGVYKPHPSVYRLACDRLDTAPDRICFLTSNSWDAHGASAFGFRVVWINRNGGKPDRLPAGPAHEIADLNDLPALFGL